MTCWCKGLSVLIPNLLHIGSGERIVVSLSRSDNRTVLQPPRRRGSQWPGQCLGELGLESRFCLLCCVTLGEPFNLYRIRKHFTGWT